MVITVPAHTESPSGPRPINLNRDIPEVLRLLELVFGRSLGPQGHRLFSGEVRSARQPSFLWRLTPGASKLAMGYVWEEDGRIVGNATVLNTKTIGRFLVVNVAVHPDYRRRGIALELMRTVVDLVRQQQGREILLQVEKDNTAGVALYNSMDFTHIGSITTWRASASGLRDLEVPAGGEASTPLRELHRREWQEAYELDLTALQPDLNWPESLSESKYRGGFWRLLDRVLNGRYCEVWVVAEPGEPLLGLAGIWSEWMRPHLANLRVRPTVRGQFERALLAKLIRRLRYLPRRDVRLDHPEDDELVNQLLREANFRPRRTLTHMRLDLQSAA